MDFWRAYRVLERRKWIILIAVLLTTGIVALGAFTIGKKYDADTGFGPTDQAVRNAVASGVTDSEAGKVILTDDARMEEARRISDEVQGADNASHAIYYLANAGNIRAELIKGMDSHSVDSLTSPTDYDTVSDIVRASIAKMSPARVAAIESTVGVPNPAWGDILYLDNKISTDRTISRDFLKSENLPDSVRDLIKNIEVTVLNSRDIMVAVRDRNPSMAEILADALTVAYKQTYDTQTRGAANSNLKFFSNQEAEARQRFHDSQARLRAFRMANGDAFLPDQIASLVKNNDAAHQDMDGLNANLKDLDAEIDATKARLVSIPKMLAHPTKTDNPAIASLRTRIADFQAQLAVERATHTESHPDVVKLKAQIISSTAELNRLVGSSITSTTTTENPEWTDRDKHVADLLTQRKGLAARLAGIEANIDKSSKKIHDLPQTQTTADTLTRDYNAASDRLLDVSKKVNQAREELQQTDARGALEIRYWAGTSYASAAHPEIPAHPGAEKTQIAMILAAFLVSLLGTAGVFLGLEYMDTSFKNTYDVERLLDVPVNGIVPRLPGHTPSLMSQVTHKLPASPHAEAYRFLGTDLMLTAAENPFKTMMVATAKPNQGGTSTICNLAITLAQSGQTVALVDADLRRPSLHNIFDLSNEQGLATVLANGKLAGDAIQRTDVDNLFVLTGGPTPPNAWKLLRSPKMKEVIADLARDFDFVLFDTPSAVVFADAATIATMVDGVLLVVRANEQPSGSEMQVKALLNRTKARILGVVLNDMPLTQVDSARYFEHYYSNAVVGEEALAAAGPPKALPRRTNNDDDI